MTTLKLILNSNISLNTTNDKIISEIIRQNTFSNPKYESNEKHGYSNWETPRTIETYKIHNDESISIPRGFYSELLKILDEYDIIPEIEDLRSEKPVKFSALKGITLRPYQVEAVDQAMQSDEGVIISPTGSGKSLIGLEIVRQRGQKALIIVHRADLAKQWVSLIKERLGIKAGFIGDGEWKLGKITVAMVQTLAADEKKNKTLSDAFGLIISEECHHCPSEQFYSVLGLLSAKYRYGLSATMNRRDGLEPLIYRAIGPAIATISKQEVEEIGSIVPVTVVSIQSGFKPGLLNSWNDYLTSLTTNADRNMLLIELAQRDKPTLILVDRTAHADFLSEMLTRREINHVLAHGKISKKNREDIMEKIKNSKITVGTFSLLGEGLDVSVWEYLIMGSPISSEIKLMQAIGRIVRPSKGKERAVVFDVKDDCGFSGASFKKRFAIYQKHEIEVYFDKNNQALKR